MLAVSPPYTWHQDVSKPDTWKHDLGLRFCAERDLICVYRIDLPQLPYAMTPEAVLVLLGLRDHLLSLGARPVDPKTIGWDPRGDYWLFESSDGNSLVVDPRLVPPADVRGRGWQEVTPGIWLHPIAMAAFWSRRHTVYARYPVGIYTLAWAEASGERAVAPVRRRLSRMASYEVELQQVPEGYKGVQYDWWRHGKIPPRVRP